MTTIDETPEFLRDPEPRAVVYTLISVDDHVVEPAHTFEGRLPRRLADRAPRIIELEPGVEVKQATKSLPPVTATEPGHQAWRYEGNVFSQIGLNAVVGHTDFLKLRSEPTSFANMRPGCFDAAARVKDMDIAGIWSSLNFPSQIAGFCGSIFARSEDPELGQAVLRAWNDWFFEEWFSPFPDRFIPCGLTWLADPTVGAEEIRRNAERGFRAVSLPELPHWLGYPEVHTDYWDPVLRACVETDTAVCLHVGSSGMMPLPATGPRFEKNITLFPSLSLLATTEWLWSGVVQKFPTLKLVMSEGGIGFVPLLKDRLDYVMQHSGAGGGLRWSGDLSPSEVLEHNFWFCMLDDPSTLPIIDRVGTDRVMLEVDYPHSDSTWPDSQAHTQRRLTAPGVQLSADDIAAITYRNAAKVFRSPLPPGVS